MKENKDFWLFYNALSVGWHLAKIAELSEDILNTKENKESFDKWLGRHFKIKD